MDITISNGSISVTYDGATGVPTMVLLDSGRQTLGGPGQIHAGRPVDAIVDGRLLLTVEAQCPSAIHISHDQRTIHMVYQVDGLRLTHVASLDETEPILRQSARIEHVDGPKRLLTAVHWSVPSLAIGDPRQCRLQAMSQSLAPDMDYVDAAATIRLDRSQDQPLPSYPDGWLEASPDQSPGIIAVENVVNGWAAATWMHSTIAPTFPTIDGALATISVEHRHQLSAWLGPGCTVNSEGHVLMVTDGGLNGVLSEYRRCIFSSMPARTRDASSLGDMRLLQVIPNKSANFGPFVERTSIVELKADLDTVKALGFNTIYLLPVWACQDGHVYAIRDHYRIDENVGTVDELRNYVDEAHARGLRVIFDFIPQGVGDSSEFSRTHCEWLVRDPFGQAFGSHGWGPKPGEPPNGHTYSLDWGDPEYRQWIIDWALWNVRTFDIDGFRTDALLWKEPNLAPENTRPAWETIYGGVRLAEELRRAVLAEKPGFIMLSEVWGSIFAPAHDGSYQNGWLLSVLNSGWLEGKPHFTARQWMRWLELDAATRPANYPQTNFAINHDSAHLLPLRSSPLANAVSFVHMFSPGVPFVFKPELEGREAFFSKALHRRADLAPASGRVAAWLTTHPDIFVSQWSGVDGRPVIALANLSGEAAIDTIAADATVTDVLMEAAGAWILGTKEGPRIYLPSGGYMLCRLDAVDGSAG